MSFFPVCIQLYWPCGLFHVVYVHQLSMAVGKETHHRNQMGPTNAISVSN